MDFINQSDDPTITVGTKNHVVLSQSHLLRDKESSLIWNDEPAPQWLIEEALNRGETINKNDLVAMTDGNRVNHEDNITSTLCLENIISDLEIKLCATRAELADALNVQQLIENKYKKASKNVKIGADEERDDMQQKLVKIFTSVLEKFGPNALTDNRVRQYKKKHQKPLQYFGKLTRMHHKKLRVATLISTKLKQEVLSTKKHLDEKAQQYDSLVKCFGDLKVELKTAEVNINYLRNENVSLWRRIDDAGVWMQTRVSKGHHKKINAVQFSKIERSRELSNLKKKSEDDLSTIAELRNKLLRLESANSNKGFLLSTYKSQLADLIKEKDKLSIKIKEFENENSLLRQNNTQLRARIMLINRNKEKVNADLEKYKTDMTERIQSTLATKYKRSMLKKIDTMRAKYDKVVEAMEIKLSGSENLATQYFRAIKRFLKEIHEYYQELDAERDFSSSETNEREAHETACTILNITPNELTGFFKGRPTTSINYWLSDVEKITSQRTFDEDLGKLLFARAIGSVKN